MNRELLRAWFNGYAHNQVLYLFLHRFNSPFEGLKEPSAL